jgi:prevent-host-death family protein
MAVDEYEMDVTEARRIFTDVVNTAAYSGGRVVLTRRGRRIAAVISIGEWMRLRELPPPVDRIEETRKAWDEGQRWLEEHLAHLTEERARSAEQQRSAERRDDGAGGDFGASDGDAAAGREEAGDGVAQVGDGADAA